MTLGRLPKPQLSPLYNRGVGLGDAVSGTCQLWLPGILDTGGSRSRRRWGRVGLLTEGTCSESSLKDLSLNLAPSTCLQLFPEKRRDAHSSRMDGGVERWPGPFGRYTDF